ncbi:MAG: AMP-binding protein [bacterium]
MDRFKGFTLNGKVLSKDWILKRFGDREALGSTEFERQTLEFCKRWLQGDEEFRVKTSGSTGAPKEMSVRRDRLTLSARMTGSALQLKTGQRALVCLSTGHIAGLMMLVRGLVLGLDLTVIEPGPDPLHSFFLKNSQNTEPFDFSAFVPLQLQVILSKGERYRAFLNQMKAVLVGGAPVSYALQKSIQQVKAPVYQTFGMTETLSHFALRKLNGPDVSGSYQALPGVELGQDTRGCLTIKSQLTDDELLVTNDLVELKPENHFIWLGRFDNVINTGGVKVQPEKVEQAIAESLFGIENPTVSSRAFFVGSVPDEKFGEKVVGVFEGEAFSRDVQETMLKSLSELLHKYELPKSFCFVNSFVRTATGKIDRKANMENIQTPKSQSL